MPHDFKVGDCVVCSNAHAVRHRQGMTAMVTRTPSPSFNQLYVRWDEDLPGFDRQGCYTADQFTLNTAGPW